MKNLLFVMTLLLAIFLAACGPPEGGGTGGGDQAAGDTPTPIVLATPTSKPAPPSPTPRPTLSPTEPSVEETAEGGEEETETAEEPAPSGTLYGDDMVMIPAGTFTMGQDGTTKPKTQPAHEVDLPAFEIDRFEVTNDEFAYFVEQTNYVTYAEGTSKNWRDEAEGKGNHPVVYVTWDDAVAYCEWAGKRLPVEAEWEKAARGDDGRILPWGNEPLWDKNCNCKATAIRNTTAVGSFPAGVSPYGVEDMVGNVSEWVDGRPLPYPGQAPDADKFFNQAAYDQCVADKGEDQQECIVLDGRIHRGGGWFDGDANDPQEADLATTYIRNFGPGGISASDVTGFRCARDAQ